MKPSLTQEIFRVADDKLFNETALKIFRFQAAECPVYRQFISLLGMDPDKVSSIYDIPFLPIAFFRDHVVIAGSAEPVRYSPAAAQLQ